ncbi:MAG: hypothetical protein QNJ51_03615 [Calothrix sp. MO_167.B12]|nr:hypothetical protein [Calothrix sp. MO_167.B12]
MTKDVILISLITGLNLIGIENSSFLYGFGITTLSHNDTSE